jgi:hypothetical protein
MWQFLLFIAVTWFRGYLFGFFTGRIYGANEMFERYFRKKHNTKSVAIAEAIKNWADMNDDEKLEAWNRADKSLKAFYWHYMTPDEQRRFR